MKKFISTLQNVTCAEMLNLEKSYLALHARQGDEEARNFLLQIYLKEIVAIALKQATASNDVYRLIEEGCLGLVFAIQHFQPEKDKDFDRFVLPHIRENIMRSLIGTELCPA